MSRELICRSCWKHYPLIIENMDRFLKKEGDSLVCPYCNHGYFSIRWDNIKRGVPGIEKS